MRVRRQLQLCERARRSLAEQLAQLQASNESMCREAVDRAGTLAKAAPAPTAESAALIGDLVD